MNRLRNIVKSGMLYFCLGGLCSCHTNYLSYDVELKDGIYFATDSLNFIFGMAKGEDIDYDIAVRILGMPQDYDRTFSVVCMMEETTAKKGLHYDFPDTLIIPAGQTVGNISLVLHRYLDPELAKIPVVLKMRLQENENFRLVMEDECKFEFSDTEMPQPHWWSDYYMGPYSQLLMIDILNSYWDLEETRPSIYERIVTMYGRNFEGGTQVGGFPFQQKRAFVKYVITPVYEYYLEHPHEGIDIPNPVETIQ